MHVLTYLVNSHAARSCTVRWSLSLNKSIQGDGKLPLKQSVFLCQVWVRPLWWRKCVRPWSPPGSPSADSTRRRSEREAGEWALMWSRSQVIEDVCPGSGIISVCLSINQPQVLLLSVLVLLSSTNTLSVWSQHWIRRRWTWIQGRTVRSRSSVIWESRTPSFQKRMYGWMI